MNNYNKILIYTFLLLGFICYGNNNVFADRTCANGVTVCKTPEKTREQAHGQIASYLAEVGVNYDLTVINDFRIPWVDCAHCTDSNYNYSAHKIDDIRWGAGGSIEIHCVNTAQRVELIGGGSTNCNHYTWSCAWTDCPVINPRSNCTNSCIQKYICTMSTSAGSCPSTTTGSDDTREEEIPLTQTGCDFACGTANGVTFAYNEIGWGAKTLCKSGTPTPSESDIQFPSIRSKTTWTCSYGTGSETCIAYRGDNGTSITPICGDLRQDAGEDCDDGNRNNIDSCPNNCKIPSIPVVTFCGDGKTQKPNSINIFEECDDFNNISGDGCSSVCKDEPDIPVIIDGGYCGDSEVQKPNEYGRYEECDDGNLNNEDECSNLCTSPHTSNPGEKGYCGDGKTENPNYFGFKEECDDGNLNNNDVCTNNCTKSHTSLPGGSDAYIYAYSSCNLSGSGYANNVDTNTIYMKIKASGINGGKDVINLGTPTEIKDLSNNFSDRVNKTGVSSLKFTGLEVKRRGNDEYIPVIIVTSTTPFATCGNKVSFKLNGSTIILKNIGYNFRKPFIGELTATNDNGSTWSGSISLGTKIKYKLSAIPKSTLTDYTLGLKADNLSYIGTGITLQNTTLIPYSGSGFYNFYTRINSSRFAKTINLKPAIQAILPIISYELGGKNVKYYLSALDYGNDRTPIKMQGSTFIGIKIIGGLQGVGKYVFTGQGKNISNLYPSNLRTDIRKRAYEYTKNMQSGDIINKVKYVEGVNEIISGELPYETLVVKNGNVIITGSLNTQNKKLGIIVLKDGYDVNTSYKDKGNVYVTPEATILNAMIYADGGFISAHSNNGIPYTKDSSERTNALQRQLFMNGILFTRNTIGGAQYVGGYYTIPGGGQILDYDKAMIYDLNYIRRGNVGCDDINADGDCEDYGEMKEGFIIKYDSRIQTSPPKLFSK